MVIGGSRKRLWSSVRRRAMAQATSVSVLSGEVTAMLFEAPNG